MQFWIIKDGESVGPYSLDELKNLGIDRSTKIWYADLLEWTPAGETAVAENLFGNQQKESHETPLQAEEASETQPPVFHGIRKPEPPAFTTQPKFQQAYQPSPDEIYRKGYNKGLEEGKLLDKETDTTKCPPNYLVWAILSTVLCCVPVGIVAIFYSSKVTTYYNHGEFLKAKQASDRSLYWSLGSAIAWMVTYPIISALSLLWL